ncbi:lipopolysaccharide assembly protein LapA domain-containing protein [Aliidiomarina celeris]|uniref:lipopolysaccharide assembly protein LapA domain-containing protein n=1 Tax=Aliidiomarina celeris TaxID=2249428 RepID=UPI000DE9AA72|nr:lipopolysaccharide assembly protein LapA domain-containing protein [Aliidiomarina celeris]
MVRFLVSLIPLIILFLLAVLFSSQNQVFVAVNLWVVELNITVATLVAWALGLGFTVGILAFSVSYFSLRLRYRRLRKELLQRVKSER